MGNSSYYIAHEGVKRRSGRYDWGSGEVPYQHEPWFHWWSEYKTLQSQGLNGTEIAKRLNLSTTELRNNVTYFGAKKKAADISQVHYLVNEKQYSVSKASEIMGIPQSTVRNYLKPSAEDNIKKLTNTVDSLRASVERNGCIDVGAGSEQYLGVANTKLKAALSVLKTEGYKIDNIDIEQLGTQPGQKTRIKVLHKDDVAFKDLKNDPSLIKMIDTYSDDEGLTYNTSSKNPKRDYVRIDPKRIDIRYTDDPISGSDRDGVIELRRGVADISLGNATYAQVRIATKDGLYLKGMAVYSDDLPDGVDIRFNTNKKRGTPMEQVLKPLTDDPEMPFGAFTRGKTYEDPVTGEKKTSAINIVNEEGDWGNWSKTLSAQFLAKQPPELVKNQLDISVAEKKAQLDDINKITQPEIKKKLLNEYAESCDATATDLTAAAMPRQATRVILPVPSLKDGEIYAPDYTNGENVVAIRYPHAGRFEIYAATVNNNNREGINIMTKTPKDAVGIPPAAAEKLSGADFDGDFVIVIPNNRGAIKFEKALNGLKGFDPKASYPAIEGMKVMTDREKSVYMGKVSNLITDMTLQGADAHELARAVRFSMVVIDAKKHKLNWRQAEIDNRIEELYKKYQVNPNSKKGYGGTATLVSRAGSTERVPRIDLTKWTLDSEGNKVYKEDPNASYTVTTKTGKVSERMRTTERSKMDLVKDASELLSSNPSHTELLYRDYANTMKDEARKARLAAAAIKSSSINPSATKTYEKEVDSLNRKLKIAESNAPLERQAQILGGQMVKSKLEEYRDSETGKVDISFKEKSKIKGKALQQARIEVGAAKNRIKPTEEEWEAINANALSAAKVTRILSNINTDTFDNLVYPKNQTTTKIPNSTKMRAKAMLNTGMYTQAEIAKFLGISLSSVRNIQNE